MSLPVYQHIQIRSTSFEEINTLLHPELNLKHPVSLNLKNLNIDEQREIIGLIENFFFSNNLSFKFPIPIYLISDHEVSITRMPLVNRQEELPKFYSQKESKMNVKESHLADKNKLLQQEVKNSDASTSAKNLDYYGESHRIIFEMEEERKFYRTLLSSLVKASEDG